MCDYQAPDRDGLGPNPTRRLVADGSQCTYSKLGMCKKLNAQRLKPNPYEHMCTEFGGSGYQEQCCVPNSEGGCVD